MKSNSVQFLGGTPGKISIEKKHNGIHIDSKNSCHSFFFRILYYCSHIEYFKSNSFTKYKYNTILFEKLNVRNTDVFICYRFSKHKPEVQVIIYLVRELDFFFVHFTQNLKHRITLWHLIHQTEILI